MALFSRKTRYTAAQASDAAMSASKYAGDDLRRAHDTTYENVRGMTKDAMRSIDNAERSINGFIGNVRDEIESNADRVSYQVRKNPLSAVAVFLAAGLIIGSFIQSLNRD